MGILDLLTKGFHPKFAQRGSDKYLEDLKNTIIRSEYFKDPASLKPMSIFDMEGKPYVITQSDRTGANRMLTGIDDVQFQDPVLMRGGQDFMMNNDAVWASGKPITDIYRVAELLKKQTGQDPMLLPWRMAPTGSDFSNMTYETMLEYAKSNMNKRQKMGLNKFMKGQVEGWKGIDDPASVKAFGDLPTDKRKFLQKEMDRLFRDDGGLSYSKARLAIADPNQLDSKVGNLQNIGLIDVNSGIRPSDHPSYPFEILGEAQGRFSEEVPAYLLEPRRYNDIINDVPARKGQALEQISPDERRALEMGAMGGVITDKQLKTLEKLIAGGLLGGAGSTYASQNDPVADLRASEAQFGMSPQERAIADLRASEDATWLTPNNVSDAYGRANQYWDAERKAAEESGATLGSWFMPSYENSQKKAMGDTSLSTGLFAALEKLDPIGYLGLIDSVRRRK